MAAAVAPLALVGGDGRELGLEVVPLVGRAREPTEPMFLSRDKRRPYTYSALMSDFRVQLKAVGAKESLGPHRIRVLAYNDSKHGNGEELTVVHGGWKSSGHSRYARYGQAEVLSISAGMLGVPSQFAAGSIREVRRAPVRLTRGPAARVAPDVQERDDDEGADDGDAQVSSAQECRASDMIPDGYTCEQRVAPSGRRYSLYYPPGGGTALRSRPAAWSHYAERMRASLHSPRSAGQLWGGFSS